MEESVSTQKNPYTAEYSNITELFFRKTLFLFGIDFDKFFLNERLVNFHDIQIYVCLILCGMF
jgi:hypothetical protein